MRHVNSATDLTGRCVPKEESVDAEVNRVVAQMAAAAATILHARGGVPVPEGLAVAELGEDGRLRWLADTPFPEKLPNFKRFLLYPGI